jgi:hypothetical protein
MSRFTNSITAFRITQPADTPIWPAIIFTRDNTAVGRLTVRRAIAFVGGDFRVLLRFSPTSPYFTAVVQSCQALFCLYFLQNLWLKRVVEVMELSLGEPIAQILISNRSAGAACSRSVFLSNWGYTDGAILGLEERAFFLHTASAGNLGKRYWFGTKPTLTKLVVQYRGQFASQDVDADIVRLLQEQTRNLGTGSATWRVIVDPSSDLPEQKSLALLIMSPADAYAENGATPTLIASPVENKLLALSNKCGTRERHYRNTLLFLLPSPRGLTKLRNAFRETAVLEAVKRDFSTQLDEEQKGDLKGRLDSARKALSELVCVAYTQIARVDGDKVVSSQLPSSKPQLSDHLNETWKHVVESEEWVLRRVGSVTLHKVGLIPKENFIRLKDAIEAFLRYTDKPMIASRDAVVEGLVQACRDKLIGIGRGVSADKLQRKWCGEDVMLDPNEDGVWIIPPFEKVAGPAGEEATTATTDTAEGEQRPGSATGTIEEKIKTIRISGDVPFENWPDLFRSFVSPSARMDLQQFKISVDFVLIAKPEKPLDPNHPTIKALIESARQLGLDLKFDESDER